MGINLIAVAVPFFFIAIFVEAFVANRRRLAAFRLNDALADLSCGIGNQVTGIAMDAGLLLVYATVAHYTAFWTLPASNPLTWLFALVAVDFLYYWWHRASHRVNVLWAAHVVHHHSQDYNLAVALRQAWFTRVSSLLFYLPLAVLGVPPLVFAAIVAIDTLYQFWIHTRLVRRLGPLEWVMNTPSHHRVHHGINPVYIDKNYGGIFIVWDRLFGTFQNETEEVVYGTVRVYKSWDPVWANFESLADIGRLAARSPRWWQKIWAWFAPPEWAPDGDKTIPEVDARSFVKWDVPYVPAIGFYALAWYPTLVVGTEAILLLEHSASVVQLAALGVHIIALTWTLSALFAGKRWAIYAELARLVSLVATVVALAPTLPQAPLWVVGTVLAIAISAAWLWRLDRGRSPTAPVLAR